MKRGEIYYADLNPTVGSEINKKRPVLIISSDANNRVSNTVTVIPITSNVKKVYSFEVLLETQESCLAKLSKAQCQQIRTISKLRISDKTPAGSVGVAVLTKIEAAVKLHLAFML